MVGRLHGSAAFALIFFIYLFILGLYACVYVCPCLISCNLERVSRPIKLATLAPRLRPPPVTNTRARGTFCLFVWFFFCVFVSEVCNLSSMQLHKLDTSVAAAASCQPASQPRERNRDVYGGPAGCREGVKFFLILLQEEEEEEEEGGREGEKNPTSGLRSRLVRNVAMSSVSERGEGGKSRCAVQV